MILYEPLCYECKVQTKPMGSMRIDTDEKVFIAYVYVCPKCHIIKMRYKQ